MKSSPLSRGIISFLSVIAGLSMFCTPMSSAGFKDIDDKIAEQAIYKGILEKDARFTYRLQRGAFDKGIQQGMWDKDGKLTARAIASKLKSLRRKGTDDFLISSENSDIRVKIMEIKDVTMGVKFKQVKFTWWYHSGIQPLWKRFIVAGGQGYAAFAQHEDGWRYDGMELEYSNEPFPLTKEELAEERGEMQQIELDKRKEEEAKRDLLQRREKRLAESKKVSKDFGTYSLSTRGGPESCRVTDAGVACKKSENGRVESYSILFADMRSIRKNHYSGPQGSEQYHAIEIEIPDAQMATKLGNGNKDYRNTSWKNVTQWISENRNEVEQFFKILTSAHNEWRIKFRDIAE